MAHLFIVAKMHIKKAPLREQWSLESSFAVLLDDLIPWQDVVKVLWMPLDAGVQQVLEEVLEVLERVQAVGLGSLDDAVDGGAGLGSFRGVAEQPILAADGEVADGRPASPLSMAKSSLIRSMASLQMLPRRSSFGRSGGMASTKYRLACAQQRACAWQGTFW